jgi:hypothetical protein
MTGILLFYAQFSFNRQQIRVLDKEACFYFVSPVDWNALHFVVIFTVKEGCSFFMQVATNTCSKINIVLHFVLLVS